MLPTGDAGPAAAVAEPHIEERGNAAVVSASTADRADEAGDVEAFGRRAGVSAEYPQGDGSAYVWIDLLDDAAAARGYLADVAGDIAKGIGGTHDPGTIAASAAEYPVDGVGDEAIGLEVTIAGAHPETVVVFRVGRLVAYTSISGPPGVDRRVPALYLASEVEQRITAVLVEGFGASAPGPGPASYRFSFEQQATVGGAGYLTVAEGTVDGSSVSCRVRIDTPTLSLDRDLVLVGSTLWARDHDTGDYRVSAGGAVADRALLAHCPAWPVDVAASGLADAIQGDPAAYTLGGVDVLGFRGDASVLAGALGVAPDGISVEAFTVWVAAGTRWIVDLRLDASGPGAALGPLVSPGVPTDATVTVVAAQRIDSIDRAEPVRPPAPPG